MATLPPPFDSDPQTFSVVLTLVDELFLEGKVRLKTSPAANISFKIDPGTFRDIVEKHGLELSTARRLLNEISALASVILRGRADSFAHDLLERSSSERETPLAPKEIEEIKASMSQKIRLVEEKLVTDKVRQKFHAVRASKHDSLVDIRWEVVDRRYDKHEGDRARGLISVLRFEIASRPELELFPILGLEESHRRNFIIECDEDDLNDLIEILTETRNKLAQERANNASR